MKLKRLSQTLSIVLTFSPSVLLSSSSSSDSPQLGTSVKPPILKRTTSGDDIQNKSPDLFKYVESNELYIYNYQTGEFNETLKGYLGVFPGPM